MVAVADDVGRENESSASSFRWHAVDLRRDGLWKEGPVCLELLLQLAERAGPAAADDEAVQTVRAPEAVEASNIRPLTRKAAAFQEVARRIGQQARREALRGPVSVGPVALFD